jgi:hypothetical protein
MLVRRDGVGVADVRITYETDDGALLLSRYYGIFDLGPRGYERALRNEYDPVPPLVLAPQFVTSHPNWLWLNRLQCLCGWRNYGRTARAIRSLCHSGGPATALVRAAALRRYRVNWRRSLIRARDRN